MLCGEAGPNPLSEASGWLDAGTSALNKLDGRVDPDSGDLPPTFMSPQSYDAKIPSPEFDPGQSM